MGARQLLRVVSALLLVALLATGLTIGGVALSARASGGCTEVQIDTGSCRAEGLISDDGGSADLVGTLSGSNPDDASPSDGPDEDAIGGAGFPEPRTPPLRDDCSPTNVAICAGDPAAPPEEPTPAPVVVTLRDIASFRPAAPGNGMEPGGWAVVGLPANFVAAASVEVVSGTLLGQPADVRFTPVGYRWSHGDGGALATGSPGATWAQLGQREFTPTATSHVYAASGEYQVQLSVVLRAEYRFAGSPWRPIAGTLAVAGAPQRVLVGEFDTVLTQGDCIANPSGPGC